MRRDRLDTLGGQLRIQRVAVVGAISDQAGRRSHNVALGESVFDKGDFMRTSRRRVDGDWKTRAVCRRHELRTVAPLGLAHARAPFFRRHKVRVNETLGQIELAETSQILGQRLQHFS
jgi:hypothetical protein